MNVNIARENILFSHDSAYGVVVVKENRFNTSM